MESPGIDDDIFSALGFALGHLGHLGHLGGLDHRT
jgi:hypothetical protein